MHTQDIQLSFTVKKAAFFCQSYLTQKEMCVTEQDVFPPVWEIQQKALQGVLRNKTKLIVHVHRQSEGQMTA